MCRGKERQRGGGKVVDKEKGEKEEGRRVEGMNERMN